MDTTRRNILHTESSKGWGGQEKRILLESACFLRRGWKISIACQPGSELLRRASGTGIAVHTFAMEHVWGPIAYIRARALLNKLRPGLVVTHSSKDAWIWGLTALAAGVPVVRQRHLSTPVGNFFLSKLPYTFLCDRIVTTGQVIREHLIGLGIPPEKITSVPTGVDFSILPRAGSTREEKRNELGIGPADFAVGNVAMLRSWKGHEYLVKAAALVRESCGGSVKFFLAGSGPAEPGIRGLIARERLQDTVFLLGYREDVPELLPAFDCACLCSYASEGVPQSLLQAMAAQTPVIGTDCGGIPEIVKDGETGLLVPPRDSMALSGAILALKDRAELRRRVAAKAADFVRRNYSVDTMADKLEKLYGK